MTAALLLALAVTPAAPVPPPSPNADRERLEALWANLAGYDPVARTKAAFALADHLAAVPFLAEKALPVEATAEQIKSWLTDLNSEDEKEWRAAFEKLRYFDPRIELTPAEQLDQITTDSGRRRLASVWFDTYIHIAPNTQRTTLAHDPRRAGGRYYQFLQHYPGGSTGYGKEIDGVAGVAPDIWRSAAVAAVILDRIDTRASREVLLKLANGHPDARPTRAAVAAIRARFALPSPLQDPGWSKLLDFDPIQTTCWAFELTDHPERVRALKAKLPPIRATSDEVTGWLKALNSEKAEEWKPAFEELLYFRPQLAVSTEEQRRLMTTAHGRTTLWHCSQPHARFAEEFAVDPNCTLEISNYADGRPSTLDLLTPLPGGGHSGPTVELGPLAKLTPLYWQRARIAVLALQRANTPEAKAVLKQLADGHPDILPTKEAKAALK